MTLVAAILGENISMFREGGGRSKRKIKKTKKKKYGGEQEKRQRERERIGDDRGDVCSGCETQGWQQ